MLRQPAVLPRLGLNLAMSALMLGCFVCAAPRSVEARSWTTPDGKVIEAELVEIIHEGKTVILDMKGQRFEVPVDRLTSKDRAYVQGVYDASDKRSDAEIKKEIQEAAEEDAKGTSKPQSVRLTARRTWTSRAGVSLTAQFVRIVSGTVILRDGSRYPQIQYYDLSTKDRQFLFDAHVAMNKADLVPPVRPDLLDASSEEATPPLYQENSPSPSDPPATSEGSAPESNSKLPPSGFGSDTQLPPSGFGSDVKLPPGGFGEVSTSESTEVALPPSGFGDTGATADSASASSEVNLPSSGFGDTGGMSSTNTSSAASGNSGRPTKVGVPQSTIVGDEPSSTSNESDEPLFDVASLPNQNAGFGGPASSDVAKADTAPKPGSESKQGSAGNSTSGSGTPTNAGNPSTNAFGSTSAPPPNKPRNEGSPGNSPQFGNASQMQEDFQPIVTPAKRELTTADRNMQMFAVVLLLLGSLMMSGGYMWTIALAFLDSLEWGLRSLIPGMAIMFGFSEWEKASTPLLTMLLGVCLTLGGFGLLLGVT